MDAVAMMVSDVICSAGKVVLGYSAAAVARSTFLAVLQPSLAHVGGVIT